MKKQIKKCLILCFFMITVLFTNLNLVYATDDPNPPEMVSKGAILIDNKTNRIPPLSKIGKTIATIIAAPNILFFIVINLQLLLYYFHSYTLLL